MLKGGLGRLLRKFDGVDLRPATAGDSPRSMRKATEAGIPQASIHKGGLTGDARVHLWAPAGMTEDDVVQRVTAAGVAGPEPRKSFGQYSYDFPGDVSGAQLVQFALAGMRAIGAEPAGEQWEWSASQPDSA